MLEGLSTPRELLFFRAKNMIFEYKTDFMRSVQNLVARGFTHYTTGTVVKEKFNAVSQKLKTQYQTEMTSQQRWRARKKDWLQPIFFLLF